jgi:hypothetical protein
MGKVQEQEILRVKGLSSNNQTLVGCYWIRSLPDDPHSEYSYIEGSENSDRYTLTARDERCFISFQQTSQEPVNPIEKSESNILSEETNENSINEPSGPQHSHRRAWNSVGPVLPGPPRLLDLRIACEGENQETKTDGECVVGKMVYAECEYIGGTQGPSEYWWFRIKGGKRVQIGDPRPIDPSVSLDDIRSCVARGKEIDQQDSEEDRKKLCDDPRVLLLTEEDDGCVLKVKCRPVRADGYKGEVFTSKPSPVVLRNGSIQEVKE